MPCVESVAGTFENIKMDDCTRHAHELHGPGGWRSGWKAVQVVAAGCGNNGPGEGGPGGGVGGGGSQWDGPEWAKISSCFLSPDLDFMLFFNLITLSCRPKL